MIGREGERTISRIATRMAFSEPRVGCGAAIIASGRILLLLRRTEPEAGCWGLPGGKVDLFEPAAQACEREIAEELGIAIVADTLLCHADHIDKALGIHWVAPIYLITTFTGAPRLMEPEKHDGLDWFSLDALPESLTAPTRVAVEALGRLR
jgi:8-oxo-dGTP diphosphatase